MASGYYVHKDILTTNQQETFKNYFNEDYIALENLFETNNYTTTSLDSLSKYSSASDSFKYVPSYLSPEWASCLTLHDYFGPNLSGVLRGGSPTFKTCVFDTTTMSSGGTYTFSLSSDRKNLNIKSGNSTTTIGQEHFPDNFIPNKLIFVIQGAGGGGGPEVKLSAGCGGGSGGLLAVVGDLSLGPIQVVVGLGGAGQTAGKKINGGEGGVSSIRAGQTGDEIYIVGGGKGGEYGYTGAQGGAGGQVYNGNTEAASNALHLILSQNGAKGAKNVLSGGSVGGSFGISSITLENTSLTNRTVTSSYGKGGSSSYSAGSGAGSFFGNGGAAGRNGGAGSAGGYGAGGGGGDYSTLNEKGNSGKGGDAVLKVYY